MLLHFRSLGSGHTEVLQCIEAYRRELLDRTTIPGVTDSQAAELRYTARGVGEILRALREPVSVQSRSDDDAG